MPANDSGHHSIPASLIPTAATTTRAKPVKPASPKVGSATSATMRAEASTTHSSTTAGSFATSVIPGSLNRCPPAPGPGAGSALGPGGQVGETQGRSGHLELGDHPLGEVRRAVLAAAHGQEADGEVVARLELGGDVPRLAGTGEGDPGEGDQRLGLVLGEGQQLLGRTGLAVVLAQEDQLVLLVGLVW